MKSHSKQRCVRPDLITERPSSLLDKCRLTQFLCNDLITDAGRHQQFHIIIGVITKKHDCGKRGRHFSKCSIIVLPHSLPQSVELSGSLIRAYRLSACTLKPTSD
ncbi:hypothetical protein J6590_094314 [Homalodisca vitripennis]|nr:hypothetical protein J6590_094314 [Homalodisca vitripennis]